MHRVILILFLLAACGTDPASRSFRVADAAIYSAVLVEVPRLAGQWVQVATFADDGQADCGAGQVEFTDRFVRWELCLAGGVSRGAAPLTNETPGRFGLEGLADWWVLWVDADYRTLVIGTPSGDFGFVLNRERDLPHDRAEAVRDILQFNGYVADGLHFF